MNYYLLLLFILGEYFQWVANLQEWNGTELSLGFVQIHLVSDSLLFVWYKNWNDSYHQAFIQNHLQDLLELLLDPDQLSASSHSTHSSLVTSEAVRALSFLIEGSVNNNRTIHPLHELALWQPLHASSGFSKISKAFSFPKLESWMRACLTGNPFGISACLKSGKKLAWAQQGTVRFSLHLVIKHGI